jgi:hypothetical protein
MAITPSYKTEDVETEYMDKGAVTMPQINPEVDRKHMEAQAQANAADYVEWPTNVHADDMGM